MTNDITTNDLTPAEPKFVVGDIVKESYTGQIGLITAFTDWVNIEDVEVAVLKLDDGRTIYRDFDELTLISRMRKMTPPAEFQQAPQTDTVSYTVVAHLNTETPVELNTPDLTKTHVLLDLALHLAGEERAALLPFLNVLADVLNGDRRGVELIDACNILLGDLAEVKDQQNGVSDVCLICGGSQQISETHLTVLGNEYTTHHDCVCKGR